MRIKRFKLQPAMVIACIALFVSLSGGAYAALHLPKNSVTTKAIKKNAVTQAKIKNHAVTTAKLAANAKVFAAGTADNANRALSAGTADNANRATSAGTADNALKLGGVAPGSFQAACQPGALKAGLVINTSAITSTTYTAVSGFNCTGGEVQVRKTATVGTYQVKFVGSDSGTAVSSAGETVTGGGILPGDAIVVQSQKTPSTDDGEFTIEVRDEASAGGSGFTASNQLITVLGF